MAQLHYGPARVPSRESPQEAIAILQERDYTACDSGPRTEKTHDRSEPSTRKIRRAIQRKNLLGAETCAREMGVVDLVEALDLVCLVAEVAPDRLDGYARRWIAWLAEEQPLTPAELDLAVSALRALQSARARGSLRALL